MWDIEKGQCVVDLRIEDFIHNEHGPIDAGITSVACELVEPVLNAADALQCHPMASSSLLALSTPWSESGTCKLDSRLRGSRATKTRCTGGLCTPGSEN